MFGLKCTRTVLAVAFAFAAGSAAAEQLEPEIHIGATLPLTGAEAASGARIRDGYELARDQANEKGGVLVGARRLNVRLDIVDDGSDPRKAVKLLEQLVEKDSVQLLLGSFSTALVEPQSAAAERLRVPYVNAAGSAAGLYKRGYRYFFGLLAPTEQLSDTLVRWIGEEQKAGKLPSPISIALAVEDTPHGKDFRAALVGPTGKNSARRALFQVTLDETYPLNTTNFKSLLTRIKAVKADVLIVDAHLPQYIAMHRQYVAMGLCHKVVSYGARGPEKSAIAALPKGTTDGLVSAVWWNAHLGSKGVTRDFLQAFTARYHRTPDWYEAMAYEAARALFAAIEAAGSTDREKVREALAALRLDSIVPGGSLTFPSAYGQQAHYPYVVQQNHPDGTTPIVYPKIAATAEGIINLACP
jgi:branched-chain amino acid transport system substrate-binding protein